MKKNKILFVHDYFQDYGGGERLILSLIQKSDLLITSFINFMIKNIIKKKFKILEINKKIKNRINKIFLPYYFYSLKNKIYYDNAFVSGNYSIFFDTKNVKNKIYYCHSLPKIFFEYNNFYKRNLIFKIFISLSGLFLNLFTFII